jgi:hypothetical protein
MATFWQRSWSVTIGNRELQGLRIEFAAVKTADANPNTLDLKIYNLAATTRASLQKKQVPVIVVAGYLSNAEIIFSGNSRSVDHMRDGPNWITHVQCGDGEMAYTGSYSTISMAAGTLVRDQLTRIIADLAINTGNATAAIDRGDFTFGFQRLQQGYTAQGPTIRLLDRALRPHGIRHSIQNMTLQLLQGNSPTRDLAVLLSPESGLIGSPDHGAPETPGKPAYTKFLSLLQPSIRPGRVIRLKTQNFDGEYIAQKVQHRGDSHGRDWITEVEAFPR